MSNPCRHCRRSGWCDEAGATEIILSGICPMFDPDEMEDDLIIDEEVEDDERD